MRIKRTAKQGNIIDGHSGPIIGLEVVDPGKLSQQQSKDPAKLTIFFFIILEKIFYFIYLKFILNIYL